MRTIQTVLVSALLVGPMLAVTNAAEPTYELLKEFDDVAVEGASPLDGVVQGPDGALYGTTRNGGTYIYYGTTFKLNTDGSGFVVIRQDQTFATLGSLQRTPGVLYGTQEQGGSFSAGTVFRLNTDGTGFTVLANFNGFSMGGYPSSLIQGTDGKLYGTASNVFKLNADGSSFAVIGSPDYVTGNDAVIQGADGALYGTTLFGSINTGTVFKLNTDGTGFTTLREFDYPDLVNPTALTQGTDGTLYGIATDGIVFDTLFQLNPTGTGFAVLREFDDFSEGYYPNSVVQGADGLLYGTTLQGGVYGYGTVFRLAPDGTDFEVVLSFDYSGNGAYPRGLMRGMDGNLYGTTSDGGAGTGTIFRLVLDLDDSIPPTVSLSGGPADGGSYYFGTVPAAPTCSASDAETGVASCIVSGYSSAIGTHTVTATATDFAGNVATASATYTVLGWTLNGFYQPVDMGGVWNTAKNGATVPLKFEVFAGSTELTSVTIVNQPLTATETPCDGGPTDDIELLAGGATSLRYDGQFVYNWQTPAKPNFCYVVTVRLADGGSINANFKLK
jgi:uncharacterized repeat protein (TIGR03803 family)